MDAPQVSSPAADRTADVGVSSAPSAPALLSESLANVGRELGADRVYVFENIRGPDGRLWMNLASEWLRNGNRGLFDAPDTKLHPYSPDFTRWIEVLGDRQVLTAPVAQLPESRATRPRGRGNRVDRGGADLPRRRLVGIPGRGRLWPRADVELGRDRALEGGGRGGLDRRRAPAEDVRRGDHRRSVPVDRRARTGRDLHRRARRLGVDPVREPAGRAAARLRAARMARRRRPLAPRDPSRRSCARRGREPAPQRDRRAVLARLPDLSEGWPPRAGSTTRRR